MFYNKRVFNRCFNYRGRQFWRNFREIPRYFYLMHFLVKHGYDEYATWETFNWFTYTMKEILTHYKEKNSDAPFILDAPELDPYSDEYTELNQQEWNNALDEMLALINKMNESEEEDVRNTAKERFFLLFSKYFYYLWD